MAVSISLQDQIKQHFPLSFQKTNDQTDLPFRRVGKIVGLEGKEGLPMRDWACHAESGEKMGLRWWRDVFDDIKPAEAIPTPMV